MLAGLLWLAGCEATPVTRLIDPLGLFQSGQTPVRIGINRVHVPLPPLFEPAPWNPLQIALAQALEQPVHFEPLKPFQMIEHLREGRLQFAVVNAGEYAELADETAARLLAVGVNTAGRSSRTGLIIAAAKSDIKSIADIKGKKFAFGPREHPVLFAAAAEALNREGIALDDLQKELLPVPGSLQSHVSGQEAVKAVVYEPGTFVGVVDEIAYEKWPETGGKLIPLRFSRDQVRVLGKTVPVPEIAFLVSTQCDAKVAETVRRILLEPGGEDGKTLKPLGLARFAAGDAAPYEAFIPVARKVLDGQ